MILELTLQRTIFGETFTLGEMWNGNIWLAHTLEDAVRGYDEKVYGKTAIPPTLAEKEHRYRVRMTYSNRFKKLMPQLMDVPIFEGVRIHGGNTQEDTLGCILVGMKINVNKDGIFDCKPALDRIYQLIAANEMNGGTFLNIRNNGVSIAEKPSSNLTFVPVADS